MNGRQAGPKGEVQDVPSSPLRRASYVIITANKTMVTVAQLVEPRIVIPVVVGSSPISHPILPNFDGPLAQLVEQGTLNPKVIGSIPIRPTI